jgi:hypothetical protein
MQIFNVVSRGISTHVARWRSGSTTSVWPGSGTRFEMIGMPV